MIFTKNAGAFSHFCKVYVKCVGEPLTFPLEDGIFFFGKNGTKTLRAVIFRRIISWVRFPLSVPAASVPPSPMT